MAAVGLGGRPKLGEVDGALGGGEEVDSGSKITVQAMIHVYPFSITN